MKDSLAYIAKLMISISGKKLDIKFANPKKGDIKHSQASISLAKRELEIFPMWDLKKGLRNFFYCKIISYEIRLKEKQWI